MRGDLVPNDDNSVPANFEFRGLIAELDATGTINGYARDAGHQLCS